MARPVPQDVLDAVRIDIIEGVLNSSEIMAKHDVGYMTHNKVLNQIMISRKVPNVENSVHFGHKNEPYRTEEQALNSPSYDAKDLEGDEKEIYNKLTNK